MKKRLISALFLALSLQAASAANYFIVVPMPAKQAALNDISVSLSSYSLPAGVIGSSYSYDMAQLLTVSGDPGYVGAGVSWSLVAGSLPSGLALSSAGVISGTPAAPASGAFSVKASYKAITGEQTYEILVADIEVSLTGATLPSAVVGQAYSYDLSTNLQVTGDSRYASSKVSWETVAASLPAGLQVSESGLVSGTPTIFGAGGFTARATYEGKSAQASFSLEATATRYTCQDYRSQGHTTSGIYALKYAGQSFNAYCDMVTDGGGWTLIFAGYSLTAPVSITAGNMAKGGTLVTYSHSGSYPVIPNGLPNSFDQALFKGGNATWQGQMGAWVRFGLPTYSEAMPQGYPNVLSANGRTGVWNWGAGWAYGSVPPNSDFVLWDVNGKSPICGGASNGLGQNCPAFYPSTYQYHFDSSSYRELYVR